MQRILAAAIGVFAITAVTLQSQQNTAILSGTILDPAGAVVATAAVELTLLPSGPTITTVSDSIGHYSFPTLAAGIYQLKVTVAGFKILSK
jgi:protocatechuate 3,4-dioxygenase beta subunit